jgi:hypothetical protein
MSSCLCGFKFKGVRDGKIDLYRNAPDWVNAKALTTNLEEPAVGMQSFAQ